MYCEVQEAVNFLARHMYNHIPRRKVCLFAESLANFLVFKYQSSWDQTDPSKGAKNRQFRVKCGGQTDSLISTAAEAVGIQVSEILSVLPDDLLLFVNPGEVLVQIGNNSKMVKVYSASEKSSNTLNKLMPGDSGGQPHDTHLRLNLATPAGNNWLVADQDKGTSPVFELATPHDVKFTVGTFAMTRFGTTKQKTNIMQLQNIQRKAVSNTSSSECVSSATASGSGISRDTDTSPTSSSSTSFPPVYHPSSLCNRSVMVSPTVPHYPYMNMPFMY